MQKRNSYALVLGGGGAKGSYQIGAWKALKEMGFEFHSIIGTSVGALNGAVIALDDYDSALHMWENITIDKVINIPKEFLKDGKININPANIKHIKDFQKSLSDNSGLDNTPLKNLLTHYIDEKKIRKSGIDLGVVTYEFNSLKPCEIFMDAMKEGELHDYLLASSTFPGFKLTTIDGKKYVDGGLHDNVPISTAKERGYKRLIVIDVSGLGVHKKPDIYNTETIYIKNSSDTGGVFDFDPENARRNIDMGYRDTMKIFGKYTGIEYFYEHDDRTVHDLELVMVSDAFMKECRKEFDSKIVNFLGKPVVNVIRNILPENFRNFRDIVIPLVECAALSLKLDKDRLYDYKEFIRVLWEKYDGYRSNYKPVNNAVDLVINKLKNPLTMFRISHNEYENILGMLLNSLRDFKLYSKTVLNIFPHFIPAKLAFILLDLYFRENG